MRIVGRWWLLHPFLAGIYFVLTLAALNAVSLKGWADLAWPIPTMGGLGALCSLVAVAVGGTAVRVGAMHPGKLE